MQSTYSARVGDTIVSKSSKYKVQKILGSGGFGEVALCRKDDTNKKVALKVLIHPRHIELGKKEKRIHEKLQKFGSEHFHIVQWFDSFEFRGQYVHEFEILDISLNEYLMKFSFENLELKVIRPIITQMAGALMFLKEIGIIHCDIKPDNIMMVNHVSQPYKIKLIDFGIARSTSEANQRSPVQTLWYRAPEVYLGAHFNEAIDMWSTGCTTAEMFMGKVLFKGDDATDMMRHMVQIVGMPPQSLLDSGLNTEYYFHVPEGGTDWEFTLSPWGPTRQIVSQLDSIYMWDPSMNLHTRKLSPAEACDRRQFIDLMKKMLDMDPAKRITPDEVLDHPFITLGHFTKLHQTCDGDYVKECDKALSLVLEPQVEEVQPRVAPKTTVSPKGQTPQKRKRDLDEEESESETRSRAKAAKSSLAQKTTVATKGRKRKQDNVQSSDSSAQNSADSSKKRKREDNNSDENSCAKRRRKSDLSEKAKETSEVSLDTTPVRCKRKRDENEIIVIDLITPLPSPSKQRRLSAGSTPPRQTDQS